MKRFGYLIKLGGDREISGALKNGVDRAMLESLQGASSQAVMRVAIHRGRGSDYWQTKITEARYLYDTPTPPRLVRALLTGYGLICYGVSRLYHAQEGLLGRCGR